MLGVVQGIFHHLGSLETIMRRWGRVYVDFQPSLRTRVMERARCQRDPGVHLLTRAFKKLGEPVRVWAWVGMRGERGKCCARAPNDALRICGP